MNLAQNIKRVASEHGKTISQLASIIGVAQPHLSRTINNERISVKDLEVISEAIGCKVGDFFGEPASLVCPKCGARLKLVDDKE